MRNFSDGLRKSALALGLGMAAWSVAPFASAQYAFNPMNADEQVPGIRYFGTAKDTGGSMVSGVVIRLNTAKVDYVLLTDDQGRFRQMLSLDAVPKTVSASCSKPGYQFVRLTKRPGTGPRATVQIDCVLQRIAAKQP